MGSLVTLQKTPVPDDPELIGFLDTGLAEVQRQWREEFQRRREHLHQLGRQHNFPVLDISTEMEPTRILRQAIGRFRRQ